MTQLPRIRVSDNHRYLVTETGDPFFWLGDTAWELFHRLSREEADYYLDKRSQQGFSVIQAVALAEVDGLHTPNTYGQIPLFDDDPTRPNDAYFEHVDYIVRAAHARGLYIGLLPTWGDKVRPAWAANSRIIFSVENAYTYGRYLGERYRNDPNVIWVLGGDRDAGELEELWASMAAGIEAGMGFHPLMTFHPLGGHSSSMWFQNAAWLDLHMLQSGHHKWDIPNWEMLEHDYALTPTRPILDGEPNYEDHPINWKAENGYFNDYDVRKQAYRAVFAGACGHTYGHQSVWQMFHADREPIAFPLFPWQEALERPGANQMRHLRNLILSRPYFTRIPDQSLILSENDYGSQHIQATRCSEGSYALIYIPTAHQSVTVDLSKLSPPTVRATWYDPRTASTTPISTFDTSASRTFTSLAGGPDWVLVLDDPTRNFPRPGHP